VRPEVSFNFRLTLLPYASTARLRYCYTLHPPEEGEMKEIKEYLELYALISLEKQDKFERLIGEHAMELDFDTGEIRFSGGRSVSFQVLGTESGNTLTWLWAWSDEQPDIPLHLLTSAYQLKDWGEKHDVHDFCSPSVDLNRADGQMISLIASEVCKASCYYRDPYEGGAIYFLLFDKGIDSQPSFNLRGMTRKLSDLISLYDFNHRNALFSYFRMKGLSPVENGSMVTCELGSGEQMSAEFDDSGRIVSLNGEMLIS
jgi:hypothetical protein